METRIHLLRGISFGLFFGFFISLILISGNLALRNVPGEAIAAALGFGASFIVEMWLKRRIEHRKQDITIYEILDTYRADLTTGLDWLVKAMRDVQEGRLPDRLTFPNATWETFSFPTEGLHILRRLRVQTQSQGDEPLRTLPRRLSHCFMNVKSNFDRFVESCHDPNVSFHTRQVNARQWLGGLGDMQKGLSDTIRMLDFAKEQLENQFESVWPIEYWILGEPKR
jgi:hypothetical protein